MFPRFIALLCKLSMLLWMICLSQPGLCLPYCKLCVVIGSSMHATKTISLQLQKQCVSVPCLTEAKAQATFLQTGLWDSTEGKTCSGKRERRESIFVEKCQHVPNLCQQLQTSMCVLDRNCSNCLMGLADGAMQSALFFLRDAQP